MEKVTKDLRRAPGRSTTPAEPVAETPAPREQVRASAPPVAPVQAIQHEAHSTPAPLVGSDESRIDYGREIELPGSIPSLAPSAPPMFAPQASAVAPAPQPVSLASPPPPSPAFASVAAAPAPTPVSAAQPVPAAAPVAAAPAPVQKIEATAVATASANGELAQVVVPIKVLKGGTYEIVIKLQLEVQD